jgi:hypothetical protein
MDNNLEFPQGLIFKLPREKAPDFIKGSLSIKRADLDLKEGKSGKGYAAVNNWKPEGQANNIPVAKVEKDAADDLPF